MLWRVEGMAGASGRGVASAALHLGLRRMRSRSRDSRLVAPVRIGQLTMRIFPLTLLRKMLGRMERAATAAVHEVGRAALRSSIDRIRSRPRADPAARAALRRRIVEKLEETLTLSGNGKEVVSLTELGTDVSAEDAIEAFADCWHELWPILGDG